MPIDYIQEAAAACWLDDWARRKSGRRWGPSDGEFGFEAVWGEEDVQTDRAWELTRQDLRETLERETRE